MPDDLERGSEELSAMFARMSGLLLSEETVQSTLDVVCRLAHETISGTAGAGVTLVRQGKKVTAAHSDGEVVLQADELQYEMDEGPCLSAWRDKAIYRIDSMSAEDRWPRWAPAAAAMGINSCVSVPLLVRNESIGASKVYSREESHYDDRDERILQMFVDQAAVALANALEYSNIQDLTSQLKEALETRDTIGMAKGILMVQEDIDEEAAFNMLRTASQHENIRVREIARELVNNASQRAGDQGSS